MTKTNGQTSLKSIDTQANMNVSATINRNRKQIRTSLLQSVEIENRFSKCDLFSYIATIFLLP